MTDFYGVFGISDGNGKIEICTDGSAGNGVSSWSACYLDDDLYTHRSNVPSEGKFNGGDSHLDYITYISGHIPSISGSGVYDAELEAVARALISVSASVHVRVHCDSKSVVMAIHRAVRNCKDLASVDDVPVVVWLNDRQHLRSAGRRFI